MKRTAVMILVLVSVILGIAGSVSAAHGGIDPFSVRTTRTGR